MPTAETYAMYYLTETDPRGAMGLGGKDEVGVGTMGSYITAIDYKTGKTVWKHRFRTAAATAAAAPACSRPRGKLLFGGDVSGNFVAFDPANGKPLWHARHRREVTNAPRDLPGRRAAARAGRRGRHALCVRAVSDEGCEGRRAFAWAYARSHPAPSHLRTEMRHVHTT